MKVVVTGANGFTGRFVCKELLQRNIDFFVILRKGTDPSWMIQRGILCKYADLFNTSELSKVLKGGDVLLNVASIGFGSVNSVIKSCNNANIKTGNCKF